MRRRRESDDLCDSLAVVVRLSSLGDVVLTTGVLSHWHATKRLVALVVTRARFAPLFVGHPAVTATVGVSPQDARGLAWWRFTRRLAGKFRGRPLIDLHGSLRSRLLRLAWSGPVHASPRFRLERRRYLRSRDERARSVLLSASVPQRYALAIEKAPPPRESLRPVLVLGPQERERAGRLLEEAGVRTSPVAIHPYATHAAKTWPRDRWLALLEALSRAGHEWVVVGTDPLPLVGGPHDFTNATDLRTTAALLAGARALVTADSGPLHLARAVGTPVVALFGPTTREWGFYPDGPRDRVLERPLPCRPCSLHGRAVPRCRQECLRDITPEEVTLHLEAIGHEP